MFSLAEIDGPKHAHSIVCSRPMSSCQIHEFLNSFVNVPRQVPASIGVPASCSPPPPVSTPKFDCMGKDWKHCEFVTKPSGSIKLLSEHASWCHYHLSDIWQCLLYSSFLLLHIAHNRQLCKKIAVIQKFLET